MGSGKRKRRRDKIKEQDTLAQFKETWGSIFLNVIDDLFPPDKTPQATCEELLGAKVDAQFVEEVMEYCQHIRAGDIEHYYTITTPKDQEGAVDVAANTVFSSIILDVVNKAMVKTVEELSDASETSVENTE